MACNAVALQASISQFCTAWVHKCFCIKYSQNICPAVWLICPPRKSRFGPLCADCMSHWSKKGALVRTSTFIYFPILKFHRVPIFSNNSIDEYFFLKYKAIYILCWQSTHWKLDQAWRSPSGARTIRPTWTRSGYPRTIRSQVAQVAQSAHRSWCLEVSASGTDCAYCRANHSSASVWVPTVYPFGAAAAGAARAGATFHTASTTVDRLRGAAAQYAALFAIRA